MEDPWGSNAWSASEPEEHKESSKKVLDAPPKWNTFERDADENTIDVGVPGWSATSGSAWGDNSNLWHAESSTLDAWKPSESSDAADEDHDTEPLEDTTAEDTTEEEGKDLEPKPTLPTPPLSPLPLATPPSVTPPAVETPPASPPHSLAIPPSPDPFGSFESAEEACEELEHPSWASKTPHLPPEDTDEPWGGAWSGNDVEDQGKDETPQDEWELAQQVRRKRDRKVPPELLNSLGAQWDEFVKDFHPHLNSECDESQSWRKGLDNVEGLTELVESLFPTTSFPPPSPFSKTGIAQHVKETIRLTRSFSLARSSPMAHLYASKGSTSWERSVKAQKLAANDEWGWDLKHEPVEAPEPADSTKDKKGGGLLSFWSRKTSSTHGTPATDPSMPTKSPTSSSKPASPATSARPSIDAPAAPATTSHLTSPTSPISTPIATEVDNAAQEVTAAQPSAVSRFFNRFSRKPPPAATSEKEQRSSLALSANDLSFLSDVVPSTSENSLLSHRGSASAGSLEAMLASPPRGKRYSTTSSSKLPPPLAPPPPPSSRLAGPQSAASDASFDAKMAEAQLIDLLEHMGPSSNVGYAPLSLDLIESPVESKTLSSVSRTPALSSPRPPPLSPPLQIQPPVTSPVSYNQGPSGSKTATLSPALPPPLPAPLAPSLSLFPTKAERLPDLELPLAPSVLPLSTPNRMSWQPSSVMARFDNPLPPTPEREIDDFADILSASPAAVPNTPPNRHLLSQPGPSSSTRLPSTVNSLSTTSDQSSFAPAPGTDSSSDFGDFGDFISTPVRTPSPPQVPRKTLHTADHRPAMALVEKAASRPGRWPAPPSPLFQPLPPPPGTAASQGYFNKPPTQGSQTDLLSTDNSPTKAPPVPTVFSAGQAAVLPSRPASTSFPVFSLSPSTVPSTSRTPTPVSMPSSAASLSQQTGKSGLSAQDLSFFEGL